MTAQRGPKRRQSETNLDKKTTVSNKKAEVEAETVHTGAKGKARIRSKADEPVAKARKALRTAQAEVKHGRGARVEAKKPLARDQEELAAARLEIEQGRQARVRRVSFVVRLTIDEQGQFRRTEIEHVESGVNQHFSGLDGERLVAFMKACISSGITSEYTVSEAPHPEGVEVATLTHLRAVSRLNISDVRVFRPAASEAMALVLNPQEVFVVEARFQIQSSEASFAAQKPSYAMKVCVMEITSGRAELLGTCIAKLIQHGTEYAALAEMPGLPPGLYRLFTVVTLGVPIEMAGYYDKTLIEVV